MKEYGTLLAFQNSCSIYVGVEHTQQGNILKHWEEEAVYKFLRNIRLL